MARFNLDVSTLFGSLGSKSSFGSFNLSDYKSIKNGSYGKLMKSYYAGQKKPVTSDSTAAKPSVVKKKASVDDTGLTKLKKETDELKASVKQLSDSELWKQSEGTYDTGKIADAVKKFASEYNDVLSQSSKVSNSSVGTSVNYMKSMTNTMSKALSKVGITVDVSGKLTVDENALKSANMGDVKSLFSGTSSYAHQIESKAGDVAREALMSSSIYNSTGVASSTLMGMFDQNI